MTDAREALVALIRTVTDQWDEPLDEVRDVPPIVNAILAAGWTPPGERVKPSVEDVARAILPTIWGPSPYLNADQNDAERSKALGMARRAATAVLALFPGRTEAEVKAEGWDEGAQAGLDAGLSIAEKVHANGGTLNLAFIPNAPVNPYRKEADRD